jgi:hypothetical protein
MEVAVGDLQGRDYFLNEPFLFLRLLRDIKWQFPLFSTSLFLSFLTSGGVSSQKIKHTSSDAGPRKSCSSAKTTAILSPFPHCFPFNALFLTLPRWAGADYENLQEQEIRQCKVRAWRFNFTGQ